MQISIYSLTGCGSVWNNRLKLGNQKGNIYCVSETIERDLNAHHHTIARFIITISFMKFHPLVTNLWLRMEQIIDLYVIKGQ